MMGADLITNTKAINRHGVRTQTRNLRQSTGDEKLRIDIRPFNTHEDQHLEQAKVARGIGGKAMVSRLTRKYMSDTRAARAQLAKGDAASQTRGYDEYASHPLEYDANKVALGNKSRAGDAVRQTLGVKKAGRGKMDTSNGGIVGQRVIDKAQIRSTPNSKRTVDFSDLPPHLQKKFANEH
jgi:hypothetical protein